MAAVMILIALKAMIRAFVSPAEGGNPPWLTVVNFISAVAGVFCVFFCAKASVSNYAFGLVNTVVYIIYLWYWRIYGTLCLELFLYNISNSYHLWDIQDMLYIVRCCC